MVIRHFDYVERSLVRTSPLRTLRDCRVGIEGNFWLRKVLSNHKEGAPAAMGGPPLSLRNAIERDLNTFKAAGIHPFFVFNGLPVARKDRPFSTADSRPLKRSAAWETYESGKVDKAFIDWSSHGSISPTDLLSIVFDVLRENHVKFMRAPYCAVAQLAYLARHPKQYLNAVYGGSELFMFDVRKVITSFNFENDTFNWVSKKAILAELAVTDDQFLDVALLAGSEMSATFPPLHLDPASFNFKSCQELVKVYKTGYNAVHRQLGNPCVANVNYLDAYCRWRCIVKYGIVLTPDGKLEPLCHDDVPNDIHDFIGYRLPDAVYFYLSQNLISPQVLNTLVSGCLIDMPPLSNGESREYRRMLTGLMDMRTLTLAVLTKELSQFYQTRKVASLYWFEPMNEHPMLHDKISLHRAHTPLGKWGITRQFLQEESKRQQRTGRFGVASIMNATLKKPTSGPSSTMRTDQGKLSLNSVDEVVANVIGRILEFRGFLTHKHAHTQFGKALYEGAITGSSNGAPKSSATSDSELVTALELARSGVLHWSPYKPGYGGVTNKGSEKDQNCILLISRAVSLIGMKFKGVPWNGPVSRELLQFNDVAKGMTRSLRNLCEMVTLSLFLSGGVKQKQLDLGEISSSLPFQHESSTALGIVTANYLESLVQPSSTPPKSPSPPPSIDPGSCQKAASTVEERFSPWCTDVKGDLKRGFDFWEQLVKSVKTLEADKGATEELTKEFKVADEWLASRRKFAA